MKVEKKILVILVLCVVCSASAQLPVGWRHADVGAPSPAGSASYDDAMGMWAITGDGRYISANSDSFHYAYMRIRGDGQITARVVSISGQDLSESAQAGVMIREDLLGGSKHAMMHGEAFQRRRTTGGSTIFSAADPVTLPYWIRIVRSGDGFAGYISSNGSSWTQQGSTQTIAMSESVYIGLAVSSYQDGLLCTAEFDNVTVEGEITMPTGFTYQGRLTDSNSVADGLYDFEFKLYDGPINGNQLASTVTMEELDVIDGYFTVALDFGGVCDGDSIWLEIGIRPGDMNDPNEYTYLTPRQELMPTPYALYAETTGSVEGGISWGDISGRPAGLDDGDDVGITNETDPTVLASVKDGVSWGEISSRPAGLDDGDDVGITSETDPQVGSNTTNYIPKWNGSALVTGTIYDNGNVGIGTSPVARLHVMTDGTYEGGIRLSDSTYGSGVNGWNITAIGLDLYIGYQGMTRLFLTNTGKVGIGTTNPSPRDLKVAGDIEATRYFGDGSGLTGITASDSDWTISGDNMYSAVSGNVGIGTTNPGSNLKLNVAGRIAPDWGNSTNASYRFGEGTENTGFSSPTTNAIAVITNGSEKIRIASGGSVGIGTTSPNDKLEVKDGGIRLYNSSDNKNYVLAYDSADNYFYIDEYGAARRFVIKNGGNVGIGTTSPDHKLQVNGHVCPEAHKGSDLGRSGLAWDDIYYDDLHNEGAAAFTDRIVTDEILNHPPAAKKPDMFDYMTERGLEELDPDSLPEDLRDGFDILTDEMTTYNYKANYEQQVQIEKLQEENEALRQRLEALERMMQQQQLVTAKEVQL